MPKSSRQTNRSAPTGSSFRSSSIFRRAEKDLPSRSLRSKQKTKEGQTKRPKRILPLVAALVATATLVLFAANLITTNSLATRGGDTGDVNAKIAELQNQNANLQAQVASLTAVSRIYNEAKSRGYVEPDKVIYASPASPVALKQ